MKIFLRCATCKKETTHEIIPWASEVPPVSGVGYDSISVRNECCDQLEVFKLGTGFDVGAVIVAAFARDGS